ncbi:hypothetical protein [Ktedonospora formicarum]|uniref:Uncharacterized protein n=1 Tax=Ktedonospora formicarum TaxID=2778364 RepID=A0A8J3ICD4_9CHLR|nr:hypothetical protein [Ktedonospora formicarum]GHO50062.1 hypothetical protein KSX_82250 [Ktedonospora formicarum]
MALHREHVEKTQQEWLARVARERHNLSVSVEKTLSDTLWWDEEDEMGKNSGHTIYGKTLIPPRISLQSRVAPAIYRSNLGLEPEFVRTNVPVMTIGEDGELKDPSDTNMLSRFARRVTSSLAAIRLHKRSGTRSEEGQASDTPSTPLPALRRHNLPEMPTSKLDSVQSTSSSTGKRRAVKDVAEHITLPPLANMLDTPWQEAFKPLSTSMGRISSSMGNIAISHLGETRSRLAGRVTKIRLESARSDSDTGAMPVTQSHTGARVPVAGTRRQREAIGASTPMPVIAKSEGRSVVSSATPGFLPDTPNMLYASAPLTAVKAKTGKQPSVTGAKAGTAVFECTQRDATVANSNISATSVVLVTLTSDPGPVVVHFVSIQPHVGFTVHLTAPTLKQTTFNYIIL